MSKFFRSPSSDSSSSCSSSDELPEDTTPPPEAESEKQALTIAPASILPATDTGAEHTHLLLHALIEEKCMLEARKENPNQSVMEVEALAKAKYHHLSQQLVALGLIKDGLDHDRHEPTRETYRSGLDMLMRGNIPSDDTGSLPAIVPSKRRLLQGAGHQGSALTGILSQLQIQKESRPSNALLRSDFNSMLMDPPLRPSPSRINDVFERSRYFSDFQEIKLLGKGGYGAVFHVKNKIDDGHYAIKKIPFSHSYMEKIRMRGPQELDNLLREVRTLAKLDHPNIVRYYAGWIEEAQFTGLRKSSMEVLSPSDVEGAGEFSSVASTAGSFAAQRAVSLRRVVTQSDTVEDHVIFENSTSWSRSQSVVSDVEKASTVSETSDVQAVDPTSDAAQLHESLPILARHEAQETHGWSSTASMTNPMDNSHLFETSGPILTLCVQMSLHPFTLADFLSTEVESQATHCYHLPVSIDILLAILDGCEYLHQSNIVHRDLKPANVLMGEKRYHHTTASDFESQTSCEACRDAGKVSAAPLEIRIGDFGLVTTLAQPDLDDAGSNHAVGTEIYRPTHTSCNASATLDIFALGIIAFEILWTKEFSTRSERYDTINALKAGIFPHDFSARIGDNSGCMESCIRSMLSLREEITFAGLRDRLHGLRADVLS